MLRIENLVKTYKGGKRAVDGVSLHVKPGEIFGFIGHNGAGKTTTIKCLSGILPFDEGEIYINGMSIIKQPVDCKRVMAYIPDNPDLYEHMTGIGYLNFIGDMYRVEPASRAELVAKYADMLEMTASLADGIASYSHGMKQKLAVISALIHSPKLMVLDEPFVGLDPKATHTLKGLMRQMCEQGSSIFFSTHILEVAEKLCSKVAIIKNGKIVAAGVTEQIIGDGSLEDLFLELTDDARS